MILLIWNDKIIFETEEIIFILFTGIFKLARLEI